MTLQTTPADRREMVQAISERLNSPAVYLRAPTYAYRIGGLTVERDGSIDSDDEALYKYLLITQCNALSSILPGMFQKIADDTELLFPDNLLPMGLATACGSLLSVIVCLVMYTVLKRKGSFGGKG